MAKITLDIPDDLLDQLTQVGDRLRDLLRLSLQKPVLPTHIYRYILDFLTSKPTAEQILAFRPTPEMSDPKDLAPRARLETLLSCCQAETLTPIRKTRTR